MDILTQQKFMKWTVVILVILNLSTLSFLWLTKPGTIKPEERTADNDKPGRGLMFFLKDELKLSDAQADSILKIRDEQQREIQSVLERIYKTKKQLVDGVFENWEQDNDSLAAEIGNLQTKIEILTYNYLTRIKNVLGPDQKTNLKKLIGGFFLNDRRPPKQGALPREGERRHGPPKE